MAKRNYSSTSDVRTLAAGMNATNTGAIGTDPNRYTTITLNTISGTSNLPSVYPYTLVVDPDVSGKEEIITVLSQVSTYVYNVNRGSDGSPIVAHDAAAVVKHMVTARDMQEPQEHINATGVYTIKNDGSDTAVTTTTISKPLHGLTTGDGNVVGTDAAQTLTRKTLTNPTINGASLTGTITNSTTLAGGTYTSPAISSPTISGSTTLSGTVANSATITGGTIAGTTLIPLTVSGATLSGTTTATSGTIAFGTNSSLITVTNTAGTSVTLSAVELATLDGITTTSGSTIQSQLDSKPTIKVQSGSATTSSVNGTSLGTYPVTFGTAFTTGTVPVVTITPIKSFASASSSIQLTLNATPTATGFVVQFINYTSSAMSLPFNWIAVGS